MRPESCKMHLLTRSWYVFGDKNVQHLVVLRNAWEYFAGTCEQKLVEIEFCLKKTLFDFKKKTKFFRSIYCYKFPI